MISPRITLARDKIMNYGLIEFAEFWRLKDNSSTFPAV